MGNIPRLSRGRIGLFKRSGGQHSGRFPRICERETARKEENSCLYLPSVRASCARCLGRRDLECSATTVAASRRWRHSNASYRRPDPRTRRPRLSSDHLDHPDRDPANVRLSSVSDRASANSTHARPRKRLFSEVNIWFFPGLLFFRDGKEETRNLCSSYPGMYCFITSSSDVRRNTRVKNLGYTLRDTARCPTCASSQGWGIGKLSAAFRIFPSSPLFFREIK